MDKIKIGRSNKNDLTYEDSSISNFHLELDFKSYDEYLVTDLDSSNGTYINGVGIRTSLLRNTDKLKLGSVEFTTQEFFDDVNKLIKKNKSDFKKEYKKVLRLFEQYQGRKNNIVKPSVLPVILRVSFGLIIILLLLFVPDLDDGVRYALMIAVGLISVLANMFGNSQVKKNEKLDLLKLEFENRLICPKCETSLMNQNITYWKGKKGCSNSRCDAIFQ